jgi:hypothetical protein
MTMADNIDKILFDIRAAKELHGRLLPGTGPAAAARRSIDVSILNLIERLALEVANHQHRYTCESPGTQGKYWQWTGGESHQPTYRCSCLPTIIALACPIHGDDGE